MTVRNTTEPVRYLAQKLLEASGDGDSLAGTTNELLSRVARKALTAFETSNTRYVTPDSDLQAVIDAAVAASVTDIQLAEEGTYTGDLVLPTGVRLTCPNGVTIDGDVVLVSRDQIVGHPTITGSVLYAAVDNPPKIALVYVTSEAPASAVGVVKTQVTTFLEELGVTYETALIDSDNYVQAVVGGGTGSAYQESLDGIIVIEDSDSHNNHFYTQNANLFTAMNAVTSTTKMLIMQLHYGGANAGVTGSEYRPGSPVPMFLYSDPSGAAEVGPVCPYVSQWAMNTGTTLTRLLYGKKASAPDFVREVAWEYTYPGKQPHMYLLTGHYMSTNLNRLAIGIYLDRMGLTDRCISQPLFLTIDDSNTATSATCIASFAAALRSAKGSAVAGWGSDGLVAGGFSEASPTPAADVFAVHPNHTDIAAAWAHALDVVPHIVHDHKLYGAGVKQSILNYSEEPEITEDERMDAFLGRVSEAQAWAGFPLSAHYNGFMFCAWGAIYSSALKMVGRLGVRTIRNATSADHTSDNGETFRINGVTTPDAYGEYREALGQYAMSALRSAGLAQSVHLSGGRTVYLHGAQFSSNNTGGLIAVGLRQLSANDSVTVNGVEYKWMDTPTGGRTMQRVATGNPAADMVTMLTSLKDLLAIDFPTATISITSGDTGDTAAFNNGNLRITPGSPTDTITLEVNTQCAKFLQAYDCKPRDIATEILTLGFINVAVMAPVFRVARLTDWAMVR